MISFSENPATCQICKRPIEEVYRLQNLCEDCVCSTRCHLWPAGRPISDSYSDPSDAN